MIKGDRNGRRKVNSPRLVGSHRSTFNPLLSRHDLCAGMLGHAGAGFDEGVYGGVFRTIRIHPVYLQGKDKR